MDTPQEEQQPAMRRGKSDAETCRLNGWTVGTQLEGDEGYGPTVIQITAVGERSILARAISHKGKPEKRHENSWTLECRDWVKVGQASNVPSVLGAREALVQKIAEAIVNAAFEANTGWGGQESTDILYARAVLPLVEAQVAEAADEYDGILTRQGELLTRTVNILKGDPPELTSWSHHDVPELAQALRARAESAEAKVAKVDALAAEHDHCSGCPTPWWLRAVLAPTATTPAKELDHE